MPIFSFAIQKNVIIRFVFTTSQSRLRSTCLSWSIAQHHCSTPCTRKTNTCALAHGVSNLTPRERGLGRRCAIVKQNTDGLFYKINIQPFCQKMCMEVKCSVHSVMYSFAQLTSFSIILVGFTHENRSHSRYSKQKDI